MPHRDHLKSFVPDSDEAKAAPQNGVVDDFPTPRSSACKGDVVSQVPAGVAVEHPHERKFKSESPQEAPDKSTGLFGLPKVIVNLGAVGFCLLLFGYVVIDLVKRQDAGSALAERLMDKFDATLEKHDGRQREWMRSHGDLIRAENDKTRSELRDNMVRQERFQMDMSRLHEAQLQVLKQIRDEKKTP